MGSKEQDGLEEIIFPDLVDIIDLQLLSAKLHQLGWNDVNFLFHLGRKSGAIDVQKDNRRLLFYQTNLIDKTAYQALEDHDLPHLKVYSPKRLIHTAIQNTGQIIALEVPIGTRALDSRNYPEQQPTTEYLGSFEIMISIAKFLSDIFKKTNMLPPQLTLNKLALVPSEETSGNNIIRLIPPLNLKYVDNWQGVLNDLQDDLNIQNPEHDHTKHINTFKRHFTIFLEQK